MRPRQPGEDALLKLIHVSMLGGTLVFFAVVYFLYGVGGGAAEAGPLLRWGWLVVAVGAVFVIGVVRGRLQRGSDDAQRRMTGILIWALAEGVGLLGMVSTILTGDVTSAIGATLVAVFLMFLHRPSRLG